MMLTMCMPLRATYNRKFDKVLSLVEQNGLTVNEPRSHKEGSGPTEKISRSMSAAANALMHDVFGNIITNINDTNIEPQMRLEK